MKIEKIKKLSNGKYQLILDNKEVITTYDEIIINNMLFNGKELNNALLSEISLKNNYYDLYNKIIKMISTKWRSIYEIKEFLKKNSFEDSDSIINDLKAKGLLNDLRYAKSYASDQINLAKVGPYKIKSNLEKLKIDKEIIEEVMATLNDDLIHENLVNIVLKKSRLNNHYSLFQLKTKLKLEKTNGSYKTGFYVKDNLLGNGTLTYIDPETKIYGALGHYIIDSNTNEAIKISDGSIFKSVITNITKSTDGNPGSINTKFYRQNVYGTITQNTNSGIFGTYNNIPNDNKTIPVAKIDEVKLGKATIYTSLYQGKTKEYTINILKIDKNSAIKNIYFEINDENLIKDAGGIVQGMSGSPIVQNGKLIGAVTHVTIDNVKTGYGISIINMLEQGEKGSN